LQLIQSAKFQIAKKIVLLIVPGTVDVSTFVFSISPQSQQDVQNVEVLSLNLMVLKRQ